MQNLKHVLVLLFLQFFCLRKFLFLVSLYKKSLGPTFLAFLIDWKIYVKFVEVQNIFFIALAIFGIYIIIYRKTQKVKKGYYSDEKIALKNRDNK